MRTTFPRRSAAESGGELSHAVAPPREGISPSMGNGTAAGCLAASKSLFAFMKYAFHMLGCVGEVRLHHSGRRHRSASAGRRTCSSPASSRSHLPVLSCWTFVSLQLE